MTQPLWLALNVNPEPWAVGPLGVSRRGGKLVPFMGRNQQLANFQEAVREAVRDQWGDLPPMEGHFEVTIYWWRQISTYTTEKERSQRKHEVDTTNVQKAVEDALQGVVYVNDKDNISVASHMMGQDENQHGQIVVKIRKVEPSGHRYILMAQLPPHIITTLSNFALDDFDTPTDNSWPPKDGVF